jgi:hypothetical protein
LKKAKRASHNGSAKSIQKTKLKKNKTRQKQVEKRPAAPAKVLIKQGGGKGIHPNYIWERRGENHQAI